MKTTTTSNAHLYNLKLIGEDKWNWTASIVLRIKFSKEHERKMLNRDALKHLHKVTSRLFPKAINGYNNTFLGVCTAEEQESTGLLHHHAILGDVWKTKLWFNDSLSQIKREEDLNFKKKEEEYRTLLAKRMTDALLKTPFLSEYLGKKVKVASALVTRYETEAEAGASWKGYIVKEDANAYWSPEYHRLVSTINQISQEDGIIPDELLRFKCWSKARRDKDFSARLNSLLETKGKKL